MKKICIIYLLLSIFFLANAQTKKIDSLNIIINSTKLDTVKINTLLVLIEELINISDYNAAFINCQKVIIVADKIADKKSKSKSLNKIGFICCVRGEYNKAMLNYSSALKLSQDIHDESGIAAAMGNIGIVYFYRGSYPEAFSYYLKSLKIYDNLNNKRGIARTCGNIATIYSFQKNYNKALSYYFRSLKIGEEINDIKVITGAIGNIGNLYENINNYEKAREYKFKVLGIYQNLGDQRNISNVLHNIGNSYSKQNSYDQAIFYYKKALKISETILDKSAIASTLNSMGYTYVYQKQYKLAEPLLLRALALSIEIGELERIQESNENLSLLYAQQNINDKALAYYKASILYRDSITNKENIQKQVRLEMNFDFEKKQALEKADQDKKDVIKEKELKEKNYFIVASFGLVLITILIAWLLIYQNKLRTKQQKQDLKQKLLQTQMNPHFIFNSLNSIQSYIYKNDSLNAGIYLSRFAELIRMILENSRENFVSLEKEIKGLNNYLELQQLRFENKFSYTIEVDKSIDLETIAIPPMLAQPFIENALEHGLLHKQEKGTLTIRFTLKNNLLIFEVQDDGVGLNEAMEMKKNTYKNHKSLATIITNERLLIINKRKNKKILLDIIDLNSSNNNITGTKVVFSIPFVEI